MHFNAVDIAAWIIISAAIYWFSELRSNEEKQRKSEYATRLENEAARLEYEDEKTSAARRKKLLIRYPRLLVAMPNSRYFDLAKETEKPYEKTKWTWVERFWMAVIIAFFGVDHFGVLVRRKTPRLVFDGVSWTLSNSLRV